MKISPCTQLWVHMHLFLCSSGMSSIISTSLREGHEVANCWSHFGPCHHSYRFTIFCVTPREMRSAGFSRVLTCFQSLMLVVSWVRATLLAMNVFHLIASEEIHDKTIVESVQRWTLWISTFNIGKTLSVCSASNTAPNSSNLGKVTFFTGVSPECEHNKWLDLPLMINWHQVNKCSVCHFWSICEPMNLYFDCSLLLYQTINFKMPNTVGFLVELLPFFEQFSWHCFPDSTCGATVPARISCM